MGKREEHSWSTSSLPVVFKNVKDIRRGLKCLEMCKI